MSKKGFADFVSRQAPPLQAASLIDKDAELQLWRRHLGVLSSLVESALADFTAAGQIIIESKEAELTEDALGTYNVPSWKIKFGKNEVSPVPIEPF